LSLPTLKLLENGRKRAGRISAAKKEDAESRELKEPRTSAAKAPDRFESLTAQLKCESEWHHTMGQILADN
jgi:hypothetical protein